MRGLPLPGKAGLLPWSALPLAPATAWGATRAEAQRAMSANLREIGCSVLEVHGVVQDAVILLCLLALTALAFALIAGQAAGSRLVAILACLFLATLSTEIAAELLGGADGSACGKGA